MIVSTAFSLALLALTTGLQPAHDPLIREVHVEGNQRVSEATVLHHVSHTAGSPYDERRAGEDIRRLFALGLFRNIEILRRDAGEGRIDLVYRVEEHPLVSGFVIEGLGPGSENRLRDFLRAQKLEFAVAGPYRPFIAHEVVRAVRLYMAAQKHPQSEVRVETEETGSGTVRVRLRIRTGPRLEIREIRFDGNESISSEELSEVMARVDTAPFWGRWTGEGRYIPEELEADLRRLERHYRSRGFAAVRVGPPRLVALHPDSPGWNPLDRLRSRDAELQVRIPVVEGPVFVLGTVEVEGDAGSARPEVAGLLEQVKPPRTYDLELLEKTREGILEALGRRGYALAGVELAESIDTEKRSVRAVYRIHPGDPVLVGRIRFEGNARVPDRFLRRELRLEEGDVYDVSRLDSSIARLNRSNLVREVSRRDVALAMNPDRSALDITFRIREKERQGIFATGGTGGIGGGYLGVLYTAFNLLGLGETLSFEMDGGASQKNVLLNIVGRRFLGIPFTLGLSAFHRFLDVNVANLVPDSSDLVGLLRRRSTGGGISGAWPVTERLNAGVGMQLQHETISLRAPGTSALERSRLRTDLAPFVLFDTTRGSGPDTRGERVAASYALAGSPFLNAPEATRPAFSLTRHLDDPWTRGRNSFGMRFEATKVLAHGSGPLGLEHRLYQGDETVRGFGRGSLGAWSLVADGEAARVQPAGSDTVVAFSAEYRVPIRGPLSSAAFVDLGWSRLSPGHEPGSTVLGATNGLLRSSVGGELRLQLPVIHQPARLIFAWNPLRLDTLVEGASKPLRLADPRTRIRFALGNLFGN